MARQSKGFCKYCGREYTRGGMFRHINTCGERKKVLEAESGQQSCGYFQLLLYGKYDGDYWLLIEIQDEETLQTLDVFIRNIWVECCGHLSRFDIGGEKYDSHADAGDWWGGSARSMNYKLKDVLSEGLVVGYEYDFGTTTELVIKVLGHRTGARKKDAVTILSRNMAHEFVCSRCGVNRAQWVWPDGFYDGDAFRCDECLEEGEEEYYLPVCNSPRMGMCGYEGSDFYPDVFEPDKKPV